MGVRRRVPWPADPHAAVRVARALSAEPSWCWLDGDAGEHGAALSYLGVASEVRQARPGEERTFLAELRAGSPAGWVVALGYEFGVRLLGLDPAPDDAAPAVALRLDTVLVIDAAAQTWELQGPSEAALDAWLARYGGCLGGGVGPSQHRAAPPEGAAQPDMAAHPDDTPGGDPAERSFPAERAPSTLGEAARRADPVGHWRRSAAQYEADVEACRAAILAGDAYVLCLTDTATGEIDATVDPLDLFLAVRGAARGAVIVAETRALISASPERFLSVRGPRIATHPIKGTRPRGDTPVGDAALAAELAADPKERAENLMIVDLMRNDLSRVCRPGSVCTSRFLEVETHPHVHQLVSTIEGELSAGRDAADAIVACFPGGSMTGAPKRRAVEILAALEGAPRGWYSGCFGWIRSERGTLVEAELAMTIRSIELRGVGAGRVRALVGAGGGITIDSDPTREEREKVVKAEPLRAALTSLPRYS